MALLPESAGRVTARPAGPESLGTSPVSLGYDVKTKGRSIDALLLIAETGALVITLGGEELSPGEIFALRALIAHELRRTRSANATRSAMSALGSSG